MKVTLLGHASVLVEMDGATCLMDPVFSDPFEDGAVASCPKREVAADKLPRLDLIAISHQHLDHFDIPTLAQLPRNCDVLCPKDKAIVYVLDKLGFNKVRPTASGVNIKFPRFELFTTQSSVTNVTEFGVVFKDRSGVFWNQVDTVLMPSTIRATVTAAGRTDLLFAMYASQNFGFFENKSGGFPDASHAMNLTNIASINPRLVVPGSAGFRFVSPFEWCNSFLFPVSREDFLRDLASVAPDIASTVANPGDMFNISPTAVERFPNAAAFARTVDDDTHLLHYDATAPVPALADPNPDGYEIDRIASVTRDCFAGFSIFVRRSYAEADSVVEEFRRHRTSYGLGVVFPDSTERWLRVQFNDDSPTIEEGVETLPPTGTVHRIAASALCAWVSRQKSYFYFRGFSRRSSTFHTVERTPSGVSVQAKDLPDLLTHYLLRKAPGAEVALKQRLDFQLAPYLKHR